MLKTTFSIDGFSKEQRNKILSQVQDFFNSLKEIGEKESIDVSCALYIADSFNMHTPTAKNVRNAIDAPYLLRISEKNILQEDQETLQKKIARLKEYEKFTREANKIVIEAKKERNKK